MNRKMGNSNPYKQWRRQVRRRKLEIMSWGRALTEDFRAGRVQQRLDD